MNLFRKFPAQIGLYFSPKYSFASTATLKKLDSEIEFTENCLKQIDRKRKNDENKFLRVEIEGGVGCSGYSYRFKLDDEINEDDFVYEMDQRKYVLVDELTLGMMKGSTIDYEETMARSGFVVAENPNADQSCSCKVSFSPKSSLFD